MIRLRNDLAIFGETMDRSSVRSVRLLQLLSAIPVSKRSVARGTGDKVVNKLGNWADVGLAMGELSVPLQCPGLARKILPVAVAEDVTMELLAKLAVVWELKA